MIVLCLAVHGGGRKETVHHVLLLELVGVSKLGVWSSYAGLVDLEFFDDEGGGTDEIHGDGGRETVRHVLLLEQVRVSKLDVWSSFEGLVDLEVIDEEGGGVDEEQRHFLMRNRQRQTVVVSVGLLFKPMGLIVGGGGENFEKCDKKRLILNFESFRWVRNIGGGVQDWLGADGEGRV